MTTDRYDDRPYTQHAYAETHPSRVAAVARLAGWSAPQVERARVIELGCGRGGNLLPMAAGLPRATFVGVDRAARQIADARAAAAGAALANVTFVHASFGDFEPEAGSFDFVVCHGVASWIAPAERAILFARIARALAPSGIAHVSANVLPGWYDNLAARDWLRFAASAWDVTAEVEGTAEANRTAESRGHHAIEAPPGGPERAPGTIDWLRERVSPELDDYRRRLGGVATRLRATDPAYAAHEYLADEHHPMLVGALLREAGAHGLDYLGDAAGQTAAFDLLPDDVQRLAASLEAADAQQLADFVRCSAFRRVLLVRADEARRRSFRAPVTLDRDAIRSLRIASRLREATAARGALETFTDGELSVHVSDPAARRALRELARVAPADVAFEALAHGAIEPRPVTSEAPARSTMETRPSDGGAASALASEIFDLWLATSAIDLLASPLAFVRSPADRPVACPLARWQAAHGGVVTNRRHEEVQVPDAIVRWVLPRLDGTRTCADLAREARSLEGSARATDSELEQVIAACIDRLGACALLVA